MNKESTGIAILFALVLGLGLSMLGGCAAMYTASTTVHYEKRPDGTLIADYTSNKDQVGLEAHLGDASIKVDKASTADAVVAAVLQTQTKLLGIIESISGKAGPLAAGS